MPEINKDVIQWSDSSLPTVVIEVISCDHGLGAGWMRLWVIFSLLLLLELGATHRLRGRVADTLKILVII